MDNSEPVGSAYVRLLRPLGHHSLKNHIDMQVVTNIDALQEVRADICVVQRHAIKQHELVQKVVEFCQLSGAKLVHEIDDDLFGLMANGHKELPEKELHALTFLAQSADRIITSSLPLKDSLSTYNENVVCVPNAHDEALWLDQSNGQRYRPGGQDDDGQLRVLYMGTKTHGKDLEVIRDAWCRIENEYGDRVVLDVVGGVADGQLGFGNQVDHTCRNYREFVQWFRSRRCWHIGVIPLDMNSFNRKKSYIKFLDYAALGLPIICSDIEPYREIARDEINSLMVKNTTDAWFNSLKLLIEDAELRANLGSAAYDDLRKHHTLKQRAIDFYSAYREVLN
jgi:glycosyltransferase involved in cell wall biosynthesis